MTLFSARLSTFRALLQRILRRPGIYWIAFTIIICGFIFLERSYPIIVSILTERGIVVNYPDFFPEGDRLFSFNFIEWFGVLYGFLLPLVLVRVWEQFDAIDREFDREIDAIKMLYEDSQLLGNELNPTKIKILTDLQKYVDHVAEKGREEHNSEPIKNAGFSILRNIRKDYKEIVASPKLSKKGEEHLLSELLNQLNNIIDARGDRIALSNQRLFQSIKSIAVITSVIWLLPFYFIKFMYEQGEAKLQLGFFGNSLILVLC